RGAPMGMSELECRVAEFSALVKSQLRLIRQLEKRGKDLTSAKIVFDSLRLSFFLAVQDWHRTQSPCGPAKMQTDARITLAKTESKPRFYVVPGQALNGDLEKWTGSDIAMMDEDGKRNAAQVSQAPSVVETHVEQAGSPSVETSEFRPLTEEEKSEFLSSLDAHGKALLLELGEKATAARNSDESPA